MPHCAQMVVLVVPATSIGRRERSYGAFLRSVELPTDVQADKVTASFKNGVLEVRLPKTEEAKTKTIKVKIG